MNFNFGEHFHEGSSIWVDLFVTIIGGIIGFGSALWLYYKQNKNDHAIETASTNNEFADTLKYLKLLLEGVVETIFLQSKNCIQFAHDVKIDPTGLHDLMIIGSRDIDRLHSMDSARLFLTFRHRFSKEQDWIRDFQRLYSHLDFIYGHLKEMASVYAKYRQHTYERLMKFKAIVDDLPNVMAHMSIELQRTAPASFKTDKRFIFLMDSIEKYHSLADRHAKVVEYDKGFLEPVLHRVMKEFETEFFGPTIMDMCKRARVLIHDISVDSGDTADSIFSSPGLLEDSKVYLSSIAKRIDVESQ